jgi:hypothetical protein
MDPPAGKSTLAELPLPPTAGENYLSKIATAFLEVEPEYLDVQLIISLNSEGLQLADEKGRPPSQRTMNKIKAIMDVAATKTSAVRNQAVTRDGRIRRKLEVRKR